MALLFIHLLVSQTMGLNTNRRLFVSYVSSAALTCVGVSEKTLAKNRSSEEFGGETSPFVSYIAENHKPFLVAFSKTVRGIPFDNDDQLQRHFSLLNQLVTQMEPVNRNLLLNLLDQLNSPLTKPLLTGIYAPWSKVSDRRMTQFIRSWQDSGLKLKRQGMASLLQVANLAHYLVPDLLETDESASLEDAA